MRIARRPLTAAAVGIGAALLFPATGLAGSYPPATDPGKGPKAVKPGGTLKVCKRGCQFKKIQKAIDAAGKGTTIRVGEGIYKEGLKIQSPSKDRIRLIGDPKNRDEVILEGRGLRGSAAQNGVLINNADRVQVNGFTARNYKGNGFFVVNADGYKLTNLVAEKTGVYGIYAFNSKGGEMSKSEAFYNNDAGFYVGQTPPQTRPKRTTLKNLVAWGNVLGYSGTNSRYVTITRSKFFNNGVGIVPNVLESEKFMPHEDNAIVDNDIFWNNFNYYAGAPFKLRETSVGGVPYPPGVGVFLFGGRTTRVEGNRIWGNYLSGFAGASQFLLKEENLPLGLLEGNEVRNNKFGLDGGADLNGRDMFYEGSGSKNCFEGNVIQSPNVPSDNSTFAACPKADANAFNEGARNEALSWALDGTHEQYWVRNPHVPIMGIQPLERWTADYPGPEVK
jgi:Periplasmic copper-binding protein (NosD)